LLGRAELEGPIARGVNFYLKNFLHTGGIVPYYCNGSGPLDANNFAQMVITLERLRPTADWADLADQVLCAAIRQLWLPRERSFAYQRKRGAVCRINYPRWTQVWMMHALGIRLF
jgi:hypothetical protein